MNAEPLSENRYAARKRSATREAIMDAYEVYRRGEPGALNRLIDLVREFAYAKVKYLDFEFNSGGADAEDWAQDVALDVWRQLDDYRGDTASSFYAWVHKIAFNTGSSTFNALLEEKDTHVDLTTDVMDGESGEGMFEDDNPEVYENALSADERKWTEYDGATGDIVWTRDAKRGKVETVPGSETSMFDIGSGGSLIPDWVGGDNLVICDLYRRGKTYKQIGRSLNLSEDAVKQRVAAIRKRAKRERAVSA
jgi:DNA-directed RNA polymerase specialized sigma24 family protein